MGIDKEIERYHTHLISDDVSTLDPVSDNFGSKFGSHPFYEGRIRFYKQEVLFVLHKQIPDRDTFDEVRDMCEELQTARIRHAAVQYNQKSRHDQRWLVSSAEETYEKYLVPEEDWPHGEAAVSTAMQILF